MRHSAVGTGRDFVRAIIVGTGLKPVHVIVVGIGCDLSVFESHLYNTVRTGRDLSLHAQGFERTLMRVLG